eukprot:TRINITY_DN5350_c0_g1_i2.p1 TRINITY_DN5350_c0_g1~~TRINITY_DN5350_c0_g1_i2.p1  ORF type:complete len:129 (-),score=25.11 TRINITY_DN5350_c0_g1_i2:31-417(-)
MCIRDRVSTQSTWGMNDKMTGLMGTYHWMAPEIFDDKGYSIKADVYSFAIVLWEIICRETPYKSIKAPQAIMKLVLFDRGRPDTTLIPPDTPEMLADLMFKCWDHDPDQRPSFERVLEILKKIKVNEN